jgi:hypothetical protein
MATSASKISYKSALVGANAPAKIMSNLEPSASEFKPRTFWEESHYLKEQIPDECSNQWEKAQYAALKRLQCDPTFQKKFSTFAENILCISATNTELGCRINLEPSMNWNDETSRFGSKGKKMKNIGFWFIYRQDGFSYNVVYECDDIDDPRTGWFYQWEHDEDCGGFSCDYFCCHYKYPSKR